MIKVGIISEYNPFHNGHLRQIEAIRRSFDEEVCIVALMSGNYVQRGEFAIFPKLYRAEMAIRAGVDLVLEYPYPWSGSCAESFALGGVALASALSLDYLCFGSETGSLEGLLTEKARLQSEAFQTALDREVKRDPKTPYAVVRDRVYSKLYREPLSKKPNDILGVSYLSAIDKLNSPIKPLVIKREGMESASASRAAILDENYEELKRLVPQSSYEMIQTLKPCRMEEFGKALLKDWLLAKRDKTEGVFELSEDLFYRLRAAAKGSYSYEDFLTLAANPSYTNARIRRVLLSTAFGVTGERVFDLPRYTVLLGAGKRGRKVLGDFSFPILTRMAGVDGYGEAVSEQVKFANTADDVFYLYDSNRRRFRLYVE